MDIRITDDGRHDLSEERLKELLDPFNYARLFYYADVTNEQRGLAALHVDEHKIKGMSWKRYNGIFFDPKRWDENDIDLLREECLRMVALHRDLIEQIKKLHKIRDSRKKRIERDPRWDYEKNNWKPGQSPYEAKDAAKGP